MSSLDLLHTSADSVTEGLRATSRSINANGSICLDILREQWSPALTISKGTSSRRAPSCWQHILSPGAHIQSFIDSAALDLLASHRPEPGRPPRARDCQPVQDGPREVRVDGEGMDPEGEPLVLVACTTAMVMVETDALNSIQTVRGLRVRKASFSSCSGKVCIRFCLVF